MSDPKQRKLNTLKTLERYETLNLQNLRLEMRESQEQLERSRALHCAAETSVQQAEAQLRASLAAPDGLMLTQIAMGREHVLMQHQALAHQLDHLNHAEADYAHRVQSTRWQWTRLRAVKEASKRSEAVVAKAKSGLEQKTSDDLWLQHIGSAT